MKRNVNTSCHFEALAEGPKATPLGGPERQRVDERSKQSHHIHKDPSRMLRMTALLCTFILALPAWASCDGGTWITAIDGKSFCKSDTAMNWWSAMTWCRQNDMQLASVTSLCPSSNITEGEGCPNMGDEHTAYFGWTRSLCSDGKSWAIGATIHMRPAIYCGDRTATKVGYKSQYQSALCEEIPAASND